MEYNGYICPYCATFSLVAEKGFECSNCGGTPKGYHLKAVHDYARYLYRYWYFYKEEYQNQIDQKGEIVVRYSVSIYDIYTFISLAILSGIIGNISTDIVRIAVKKIVDSYNRKFNESFSIGNSKIESIRDHFDNYLLNKDDIDKKVYDAVLEEIVAHESGKIGKKIMFNNTLIALSQSEAEKERLRRANDKMMKRFIKETGRRIKKIQDAKKESFDNYWGRIKIE